jgi:hypothetical protein
MKEDLSEGPLSSHREITFSDIRKCSSSADLCAKRLTITEIAGHGPFGNGMKRRGAKRTYVETGLAAHTSFFICHYCIGPGNALSGTGRANIHTGGFFAVLTDNRHEDRNLFPFFYAYPGKGRAAGALMGETAGHFAGLASCAAFRDNRDGAHLDDLLRTFFIVNISDTSNYNI